MSKKHFVYAANQIAYYCSTNNESVDKSHLYLSYCSLFENFNEKFSKEKFYTYIVNLIEESNEDVIASIEN